MLFPHGTKVLVRTLHFFERWKKRKLIHKTDAIKFETLPATDIRSHSASSGVQPTAASGRRKSSTVTGDFVYAPHQHADTFCRWAETFLPARRHVSAHADTSPRRPADTFLPRADTLCQFYFFFVGNFWRFVFAKSLSCCSDIDSAICLDAPFRLDFLVSPRLAANAAPAAICCFFDFAGI